MVKNDDEQYFSYKCPNNWLRIEINKKAIHIIHICWYPFVLVSIKIFKCLSWNWKQLAWKLEVSFFLFLYILRENYSIVQDLQENRKRVFVVVKAVAQRQSVKMFFLKVLQNSQANTCATFSFLIRLLFIEHS